MKSGDIEALKAIRNNCSLYTGNQCPHLGPDNTFQQRIQDSTIKLFPAKVKPLLDKLGTHVILFVMITVTLLMFNGAGIYSREPALAHDYYLSAVDILIQDALELEALGDLPGAFQFLSENYIIFANTFSYRDMVRVRNVLMRLGHNARYYRPSQLYSIVGAIDYREQIIARIRGFVTDISVDLLTGTRITISDTITFEAHSVVLVQPDGLNMSVQIGDEVLFMAVPQFINVATPITVTGWVQP